MKNQVRIILFKHYDGDKSLIITGDLESDVGELTSGYFGAVLIDEIVDMAVDSLELLGTWNQ